MGVKGQGSAKDVILKELGENWDAERERKELTQSPRRGRRGGVASCGSKARLSVVGKRALC
jgi:hypothetical protein